MTQFIIDDAQKRSFENSIYQYVKALKYWIEIGYLYNKTIFLYMQNTYV